MTVMFLIFPFVRVRAHVDAHACVLVCVFVFLKGNLYCIWV